VLAIAAMSVAAGPALAAAPANDDFASAELLTGTAVTLPGQTNAEATGELGEPNHAGYSLLSGCTDATTPNEFCLPSVWYAWTASRTFKVTIDTCNPAPDYDSSLDTTLAVYTGSAVNALSLVASNDESGFGGTANCNPSSSRVTFRAIAGTTYRIAVAGYAGGTVSFALHLFQQPPPVNDDFAAATALSGDSIDLGGQTTLAATGQPGEPDHAGASLASGCTSATTPDTSCLSSVWYSWSSSRPAQVTIDLCDPATTIDTTLGVYTGSAVSALSAVASNDDADPACAGQDESAYLSRVSFTAAAGTVYRIAVADYARQGLFALHLRASPVVSPAVPESSPPTSSAAPGAGAPGPATSNAAPDAIAPVITGYGLTHNPFVVGARITPTFGRAAAIKHKTGTMFRYTLSEAATVRIVISRHRSGRRRAGRCVPPTHRLRHARRCLRFARQGTLTRTSRQGANRVAFSGRIGSRALKPGRYRARLVATDTARNTSRPKTITFTIVGR